MVSVFGNFCFVDRKGSGNLLDEALRSKACHFHIITSVSSIMQLALLILCLPSVVVAPLSLTIVWSPLTVILREGLLATVLAIETRRLRMLLRSLLQIKVALSSPTPISRLYYRRMHSLLSLTHLVVNSSSRGPGLTIISISGILVN